MLNEIVEMTFQILPQQSVEIERRGAVACASAVRRNIDRTAAETVHRCVGRTIRRSESTLGAQRGATIVEFAIIASLLFTLLLTIADFGQLFWTNLTMQHAVREGTRYAVTGSTSLASTPAAADARCQAALAKIREQSMGLYDKVDARVQFKTVDESGGGRLGSELRVIGSGSCYGAGEIIVVQVDAKAPVLTPFLRPFFSDGKYAFSVSTTMKNEVFE